VVVLEFTGPDAAQCGAPVPGERCQLLLLLADETRSGALQALRAGRKDGDFGVMTREAMSASLAQAPNRGICSEGSCELEAAHTLGADHVVSGEMNALDGMLLVTLKLQDAQSGALLATERCQAPGSLALLRAIRRSASSLMHEGLIQQGAMAELTFGGAAIAMPKLDLAAAKGRALKNLNLEVERMFEEGLDLEEHPDGAPEAKARLWCGLSRLDDRNPYQAKAREACQAWRRYSNGLRRQEISLGQDYQTLAGYLQLKRKTREQRLSAVDAFLAAYQAFPGHPGVEAVQAARVRLEQGGEAGLEDASGALPARCEQGDAVACAVLGSLVADGIWPLPRSPEQARPLLQKACELGLGEGCRSLAALLVESGQPADVAQGARLYQDACDDSNAQACAALARLHVEAKAPGASLPRAAELTLRACDLGDAEECWTLGNAYALGIWVSADAAKASALWKQACDQGTTMACDRLRQSQDLKKSQLRAVEQAGATAERRASLEAGARAREEWEASRASDGQVRAWGWGLLGVGLAAGLGCGAAAWLGTQQRPGEPYAIAAAVAGAVGVLGIGAGLTLALTHGDRGEYPGKVSLGVGPAGAALALRLP
jgi:hypothetical protein